jgi:DNA polymerase delta subunit 1
VHRFIFTLGGCSDIPNATVKSFDNERDMLMEWSRFIVAYDPDILTGYNIQNFDYYFLFERAKVL